MTLIKGDGIGPEISEAVIKIFDAAQVSGRSDVYKMIFNVGLFNLIRCQLAGSRLMWNQ